MKNAEQGIEKAEVRNSASQEVSVDAIEFNQQAWDAVATSPHNWFQPVSVDDINRARNGDWKIRVTACRDVPQDWLMPIDGRTLLCLGGAGGHQGPILAAAGAQVTVFDLSDEQLTIDAAIAVRESLTLETVQGDMSNLSRFGDESFDLVVNPCSVCFCPDVRTIW